MLIAIPSKARATKQITLSQLPAEIKEQVVLFVDSDDRQAYNLHSYLPIFSCEQKGIGQVRQSILEFAKGYGENKVLMLDDDLTFAIRRKDDPTKFTTPTDKDLIKCFQEVSACLENYAHVAISPREGGNRNTASWIDNTRALRALAYRVDILEHWDVKFTDMEVMEDFHVQLALLLNGLPHKSLNWMVQNQAGSNLAGGCSTYRTMEVQDRAARTLAAKYPDYVKVVQKETKTAWGGQPRTDVIISWKKAYAEGLRKSDLTHFGHAYES